MIHQSIATISCTLLLLTTVIPWVSANTEGDALTVFKHNLHDPRDVLENWNASLPNPCGWNHVTCNSDNSVTRVDLGNASLSGKLVPELGELPNLQYLELYCNNITGGIPSELANLTNLVSLNLYANNLSGQIPDSLGKLQKLRFLRLNNNSLSGEIPMSLTTLSTLQVVDLSWNNLPGKIPTNGSLSTTICRICFGNNPSEHSLPKMPPTPQSPQDGNIPVGATAEGVAVGAFLLTSISGTAFLCYRRRNRHDHFFKFLAKKDPKLYLGHLKRFSLQEIQVATDNFSAKNILGKGGFGNVYKGQLADGSPVAVKRMKNKRTQVGEKQFLTELQMISLPVHQNLLRLRGFCMTPTEKLLVYPFMANGSVESRLRERVASQPPLDWATRKYIALASASGLAYLHDCNPKIIHRDSKAANVLLDDMFEVVVGDFGLAKLMNFQDTHVMTAVGGTIGHIPPECFSTGKSSEKTDVYGYGAMLLELITGQRAIDLARIAIDDGVMLEDWVKGILQEKKLESLVDADIEGNYVDKEMEQLIQVALLCLQSNPAARPKMSEVERMLEGKGLTELWEEWKKKEMFDQVISASTNWPDANNFSNIQADVLSGPR